MKRVRIVPRIALCLTVLASLLTVAWPFSTLPAHAAGNPNIAVPTQTEHIDASAIAFTVPINFDDNELAISSVNFVLDYDETCVRINNLDTDITGVESGFSSRFNNNADNGLLQASIWHNLDQTALTASPLLSIKFTLEPNCRTGADRTINFGFVTDSVTFGDVIGAQVVGTATNGAYTLDINQAPTNISVSEDADELEENVTGLRQIGVLSAEDSDTDSEDNAPDDTLTFALSTACVVEEGVAYDNQGFSLDPADSTGLRTDRTFNFESVPSYNVCVQVSDGQGGVYNKVLTLAVGNVNDAPTDIALSRNIITETVSVNTAIGNLSSADEDEGDTPEYTLVDGDGSTDNGTFQIADSQLQVRIASFNYDAKPEYKVRVRVTDDGGAWYEEQFRLVVAGTSSLALPGEPNLPVVLDGQLITVPVTFNPKGNNVLAASFQVNYDETCLEYAGLKSLQSGFTDSEEDADNDGQVSVSLSGGAPLSKGVAASLMFTGKACAPANAWTDIGFAAAPVMTGVGGVSFATEKTDGKLVVLANSSLGDCNNDGSINAGDFSATALDLFDVESTDRTGNRPLPESWLWTPLGSSHFSARGCDSNTDRLLGAADLQCTIRKSFDTNYQCGAASVAASVAGAGADAAVVSIPAQAAVVAGQATRVPLLLQSNGYGISAFAATLSFDPAQLTLDAADADGDGLPDAVQFNLPEGMFRMVDYDAAAGKVNLVATGLVMPLPTLADGVVLTVDLTPVAGASDASAALALSNLSLGDGDGGAVPAAVSVIDAAANHLFLPAIVR